MRRRKRRRTDWLRLGAFIGGLFVGASMTALVIYLLASLASTLPESLRLAGVAVAVILFGGVDFRLWRPPLPDPARQVPDTVFGRGLLIGPFQFGVEMGTGVRTYITAALPYTLFVAAVLLTTTMADVLAMAFGFAVGRATVPLSRYWSRDREGWLDRLNLAAEPLKRTTAAGGAVVTVGLMLMTLA